MPHCTTLHETRRPCVKWRAVNVFCIIIASYSCVTPPCTLLCVAETLFVLILRLIYVRSWSVWVVRVQYYLVPCNTCITLPVSYITALHFKFPLLFRLWIMGCYFVCMSILHFWDVWLSCYATSVGLKLMLNSKMPLSAILKYTESSFLQECRAKISIFHAHDTMNWKFGDLAFFKTTFWCFFSCQSVRNQPMW